MKTRIISKTLLSLGLVFVLGSAITQVRGGIVSIHSLGNVSRGEIGSFLLFMNPPGGNYVNFSVSGTAIPGADYVGLISPAHMVVYPPCVPPPPPQSCPTYAVVQVKTLPDPRGSFFRQAYTVTVTLEPGVGYTIGEPSSAQLMINP